MDDTFKYHDYLLSVGIKPYIPITIDFKTNNSIDVLKLLKKIPHTPFKKIDLNKLINVCPFLNESQKKSWKHKKIEAKKNTKLALVMIVKNEEKHLAKALKNVWIFSNEIIIADTGSKDHTIQVAHQFTDNIFQFERSDDFSAARNFVIRNCFADFCIWMDADDVIYLEDAQRIKQLMQSPIDWDILSFPYHRIKDEEWKTTYLIQRERIFRNKQWIFFHYPVHEYLHNTKKNKLAYNSEIAIHHENIYRRQSSNKRNILIIEKALSTEQYMKDSFLRRYLWRELSLWWNIKPAIEAYKQAILYHTQGNNYQLSLKYFELGKLFKTSWNNDFALSYFTKAAEIFDFYREPFWEIGNIYLEQNNTKEANKFFEIALHIPYPKTLDVPNILLYTSNIIQTKIN